MHSVCNGGHISIDAGIDADMRCYDSIIDLVCDGDYCRRDKIGITLSMDDLEIIREAIERERAAPDRGGQEKNKLTLIVSQSAST